MTTLFTKIINHEIPGVFVYRDHVCAAFMSINPLAVGHTLVVPIEEVDEWTDLDRDTADHVFHVAHLMGQAQKKAFSCNRVGLIIAGYEINHCHLHVIPTNGMHQLSFANAAMSVTADNLRDSANTLRSMLASVGLKASE